jgi:hypothetical protein
MAALIPTATELAMLDALETAGEFELDLRDDAGEAMPRSHPGRAVSGQLLSELLADPERLGRELPATLRLIGIRVTDELELTGEPISADLEFVSCHFDHTVTLTGVELCNWSFVNCFVPGIAAVGTTFGSDFRLDRCTLSDTIAVSRARIHGQLALVSCEARCSGENCIEGDGLICNMGVLIQHSVFFGGIRLVAARVIGGVVVDGTEIHSEVAAVDLDRAHIEGPLTMLSALFYGHIDLNSAELTQGLVVSYTYLSNATMAILGTRLQVTGDVQLGPLSCFGMIDLSEAGIRGSLRLNETELNAFGEVALSTNHAVVEKDLTIGADCNIAGRLAFGFVRVQGTMVLTSTTLVGGPQEPALHLDGATIGRGLAMDTSDIAGGIRAVNSNISSISITSTTITASQERALLLDSSRITGSFYVQEETSFLGGLSVAGTSIDGQMSISDTVLAAGSGPALSAIDAAIGKTVLIQQGVIVRGLIDFSGVEVGRSCTFGGADLAATELLDLARSEISDDLVLGFDKAPRFIDLRGASASTYVEQIDRWADHYALDGFTYGRLESDGGAVPQTRLDWLSRNVEGFSPQPYEACAAALDNDGRREHARYILMEKAHAAGKQGSRLGRVLNFLAWALAGGGYRPRRAFGWFVASLAIAAALFALVPDGDLRSTRDAESNPTFSSVGYAADVLLPIIDLKQTDSWTAKGIAMPLFWLFTLWGWVLTTAIAATVTTLVSRE